MHDKNRKSNADAKPIDVVLMFKVLVPQQLHNLSDDRIEHQCMGPLQFHAFLGPATGKFSLVIIDLKKHPPP
ncbi:transposase [Methyloglobulus sp.]|uniref:transposase n=1 Tax=Methyloglobulus sp. TaxID=2518622 RepID=UPI0039894975